MKNKSTLIGKDEKLVIFTFVLFICTFIAFSKNTFNNNIVANLTDFNMMPDSTDEYIIDDTVILSDGLDTIYVIDDSEASGDSIPDSTALELREFDIVKDITINPGNQLKTIEPGLFGYHIEGMFHNGHMPFDAANVNYPNTWNWLADLKPRVLRFPGGASSKFMHLLPYDTNNDGINDISPTGYGYDIFELIKFYDAANGAVEEYEGVVPPLTIYDIVSNLEDDEVCDDCDLWMNIDDIETLEKTAKKYFEQDDIPVSQPQRYIDQFIALINHIQLAGGYTVDVILDLNILTESASQCKFIVEYLRDATLNGVTHVNVVGVEMGNECGLNWGRELMGWNKFDDYWKYINGYTIDDVASLSPAYSDWMIANYYYLFNLNMQVDHNYIAKFKSDPSFECKVGIPAANLQDDANADPPVFYALRTDIPGYSEDWNVALVSHYGDHFLINGVKYSKFDAVVLHPYYNPQNNWEAIVLNNYCNDYYPNTGFPDCTHDFICSIPPASSLWQYGTYDERLKAPFEAILGTSTPNQFGNFKQFIKTRYDESYDKQNQDLKFYLSKNNQNKKDLWVTEWNLKDKNEDPDLTAFDQLLHSSFCNSFPHGLLIHEWFLKDLKLNYNPDYRRNFRTYSTFHAWGGGAPSSMLYHADKADRANYLISPLPLTGPNTWLRRTLYYTFDMLSEINRQDLQYLPSTYSMYGSNPNIQPTVFFDETNNLLYIYYSNMKDETQSYKVTLGHLSALFPEATAIGFGAVDIYNIDAQRPYSNSGKSSLFDINTCYNDEDNLHPFEIQGVTGPTPNDPECAGLTGGAICVTVPANSFGYFTIPVYTSTREALVLHDDQLFIYPNPASQAFLLECTLPTEILNDFILDLYNLNGEHKMTVYTQQHVPISIANLPSGVYMVAISNNQKSFTITKKFVKIE